MPDTRVTNVKKYLFIPSDWLEPVEKLQGKGKSRVPCSRILLALIREGLKNAKIDTDRLSPIPVTGRPPKAKSE